MLKEIHSLLDLALCEPDHEAYDLLMATIVAHRLRPLDMPPSWLMLTGKSGCGKTTFLMTLCGLPNLHRVGRISPKTFFSGYKDPLTGEQKNYLAKIGDTPSILLIKDFTTILSMPYDSRVQVFSQFRDLHDGVADHETGQTDHQAWSGRITVLAASTPWTEEQRFQFQAMGDRFAELKLRNPDDELLSRFITSRKGNGESLDELGHLARRKISDTNITIPELDLDSQHSISQLAALCCWLRTPATRNHHGEFTDLHEGEASSRLTQCFSALSLAHTALIGAATPTTQAAKRLALDSLPKYRLAVLRAALAGEQPAGMTHWTLKDTRQQLIALGAITDKGEPTPRVERISRLLQNSPSPSG